MADDILFRLRPGIHRQVVAGGQAAVILDRPQRLLNLPRRDGRKTNFALFQAMPLNGNFVEETGRSIDRVNNRLALKYLADFKRFSFHFSGLTEEPNYNSPSNKATGDEAIYVNHERRSLAALVRLGQGVMYILPNVETLTPARSIELVFEDMTGLSVRASAPEWISEVHIHGVAAIDATIGERRQSIESIEADIGKLDAQRSKLLEHAELVYTDGKQLEARVRAALELLGARARPAEFSEEEFVFEFEGREYVIEVKGVTKSAQLEHVGQAVQHALTAEQKAGREIGGLLVVNAWKTTPPSQRIGPDKVAVPDNVAKRARMHHLPIVTGLQLLGAVNAVLTKKEDGPNILRRILASEGPVDDALVHRAPDRGEPRE